MNRSEIIRQADVLAKYLVNRPVSDQIIYDLYELSVKKSRGLNQEGRLLAFAFSHPWTIGFLDAGLVFLRPSSELRRRIYIMFSVLEASPDYAELFLPHRVGFFEIIGIFYAGIRAVFRSLIGIFVIKIGRL